jgi:hypothetical protein
MVDFRNNASMVSGLENWIQGALAMRIPRTGYLIPTTKCTG